MKVNTAMAGVAIAVALALIVWFGWQAIAPPPAAPRPPDLEARRRQMDPGLNMNKPGASTTAAPLGAPVPGQSGPGPAGGPGMSGETTSPGAPGGTTSPGAPGGTTSPGAAPQAGH